MAEKLWTKNFILLIVGSLGTGFLVSLFLNTLPVYAEQMTGAAVYAGMVTTCYTLAALVSRPIVGVMCAKMSSLKLIIIGIILMTCSCYAYTFATTITMLIFIRIIHGIGFGIKSTASGVLAAEMIPKSRFAEGIGMYGLYMPISNAIGPAFGLWVAESGSFKTLFAIAGVVGLVSLILMCFIKQSRNQGEADIPENTEEDKVEQSENDAELPKTFFGFESGVIFPSLTLMLMYIGYGAIISFVALYAVSAKMQGVGLFFSIGAVALFVARFVFAKVVEKYGYHKFVMLSLVLFAAVLLLIPHIENIRVLYVTAIFYGAGLGIVPMAVNAQVMERCSEKRRGTAMAAYTSSMDLGIGVGSLLIGAIVDSAGFSAGFTVAGVASLIAFIIYSLTVARDHEEYKKRMEQINDLYY